MVIGVRPLLSLDEAQNLLFESCYPVEAISVPVFEAIGKLIAEDVRPATSLPQSNIALREGWAVRAQDTYGATSLAPNFVSGLPAFVAVGEPLPENTDALLPDFALANLNGLIEILTAAVPGESIRRIGEDIAGAEIVAAGGAKLTNEQALILRLADVACVPVFSPQVAIYIGNTQDDSAFTAEWLVNLIRAEGAGAAISAYSANSGILAEAFALARSDLLIVLIDRGGDSEERAVQALSDAGLVLAQGLAVRPGETISFGLLPKTTSAVPIPVIFVPQRLENALASWLFLIRPCLDRLTNRNPARPGETLALNRKIASSLGRSDLVLLKVQELKEQRVFEPLGVGDLTWSAIAKAAHWLLVPPHSEGYARGEAVFGENF